MNLFPRDFLLKKFSTIQDGDHFISLHARKCNQKCNFCSVEKLEWPQDRFDIKAIEDVVVKYNTKVIAALGGEPFVDKECMDAFLYITEKYKFDKKIILSNMDYYSRYKLSGCIIHTNSRTNTVFPCDDNVIYNGIFFDELWDLPGGKEFKYTFTLKYPTYWNDVNDEYMHFDRKKCEAELERLYKSGSEVTILTPMSKSEADKQKNEFMLPYMKHPIKHSFPRDLGVPEKTSVAEECLTCPKIQDCPVAAYRKFDKSRLKDCSTIIWAIELSEKYRKLNESL